MQSSFMKIALPVAIAGLITATKISAEQSVDSFIHSILPVTTIPLLERLPPTLGQPVLTVGNDSSCDFIATTSNNGLQQALDAAAIDANGSSTTEIRIANNGNYNNRNYLINGAITTDQSITLIGGFANCSTDTPVSSSVVGGGATNSIFDIGPANTQQTIILENLTLTGANADNGAGLMIRGNSFVIGINLLIATNTATNNGGGIHINGAVSPAALWLLENSRVGENSAGSNGGGAYCSGSEASLVINTDVSIDTNQAMRGGGFYAQLGCTVASFASIPTGIFENAAGIDGGGGYLGQDAVFFLTGGESFIGFGDSRFPARLDNNTAGEEGGGVFVSGPDASVTATDAHVTNNRAGINGMGFGFGGGIRLLSNNSFNMNRSLPGKNCHTEDRCSLLSGNSGDIGGAIAAGGNNASIDIRTTWIENNQANNEASAILISNSGGDPMQPAMLDLEGNIIAGNSGAPILINLQSNTESTLAFNTITNNLTSPSGRVIAVFDNTQLNVYSNIIWESTGGLFFATWDADTQGTMDCNIVHDLSNLPSSSDFVIDNDPLLAAPGTPAILDYHLTQPSPAIDFCDDSVYRPLENDIDGMPRGRDEPSVVNNLSSFDLGADEFSDILFADDYEITAGIL